MKIVKFEMEVLNSTNYSNLHQLMGYLIEAKKEYERLALLDLPNKDIEVIKENIDSVSMVMLEKESKCFDMTTPIDYMCLN